MGNARGHDVWKTIGFSVASVALSAVAWFAPSLESYSATEAAGTGVATFGNAITTKHYEANLQSYAKLVEQDKAATGKMIDFFSLGEQMLSEETPFNKD